MNSPVFARHSTFLLVVLLACLPGTALSAGSTISKAREAFQEGHYHRSLTLLEPALEGKDPTPQALELSVLAHVKLGQPDEALRRYGQLVPAGEPEQPALLEGIASSFVHIFARDPRPPVRAEAYSALAETPRAGARSALEEGLFDASVIVRSKAAKGLANFPMDQVVSPLTRALHDSSPAVRIAALTGLNGSLPPALQQEVQEIARKEIGPVSIFAQGVIARQGNRQALAQIQNAATDPNPDTRMAALGVLSRLADPSNLEILGQAVYDPDPSARAFAAGALGDFGHPGGAPSLIHLLSDESPFIRGIAAASLGKLGLDYTRSLLWQATRDPELPARIGAIKGLLAMGDGDVLMLASELIQNPAASVRSQVAQALGFAHTRGALPLLKTLLQDHQPQPRLMAAHALGNIGGPMVLPLLEQALRDPDPLVRAAAAGGILQALREETVQEEGGL